jgi:hypothetical protein
MCSRERGAALWCHGGAIKVGKFDNQNKGCANKGGMRLRKLRLCASPVADGTSSCRSSLNGCPFRVACRGD